MIYLRPDQETLFKMFLVNPELTYNEIHELTGWHLKGIGERCRALINKGAVERKGNKRNFRHIPVEGIQYTTTFDGKAPLSEPVGDMLLESLKTFKPDNRQERFIHANYKKMSRSDIAKNLGITKLELNATLIDLKLGS